MNEYMITFSYDGEYYSRHVEAETKSEALSSAFERSAGLIKGFDEKKAKDIDSKLLNKKSRAQQFIEDHPVAMTVSINIPEGVLTRQAPTNEPGWRTLRGPEFVDEVVAYEPPPAAMAQAYTRPPEGQAVYYQPRAFFGTTTTQQSSAGAQALQQQAYNAAYERLVQRVNTVTANPRAG